MQSPSYELRGRRAVGTAVCLIPTLVLLLASLASPLAAATHLVRQDGTGDYTTIVDAVKDAADGDVVLVGPGTYPEPILLTKSLRLVSEAGPDVTILDGEEDHRILSVHVPDLRGALEGFTLRRAYNSDAGAALSVRFGSRMNVVDCRFEANVAGFQAAAIHTRHSGTEVVVRNTTFLGNHGGSFGAATAILDSRLVFEECHFEANTTNGFCGGVAGNDARIDVRSCTFVGNAAPDGPAALWYYETSGTVSRNTFFGNRSGTGTLYASTYPSVEVTFNIFAFDREGFGIYAPGATLLRDCNLYWGNSGGVSVPAPELTAVVSDPLFCEPETGVLTLSESSPALGQNNHCEETIGALGVGCDAVVGLPHLAIGENVPSSGSLVEIPVTLGVAGSSSDITVAAADLRMTWDPQFATLEDVVLGPNVTGWSVAANVGGHRVDVSMASGTGLVIPHPAETLLIMKFRVSPDAEGGSPVLLSRSSLYGLDLAPLRHTTASGQIVLDCAVGDVDDDGEVLSVDALLALLIVTGQHEATEGERCRGDVDRDGEVSAGDAVSILRMAVGLPAKSEAAESGEPRVALARHDGHLILECTGVAALELRSGPELSRASGPIDARVDRGLISAAADDAGALRVAWASVGEGPATLEVELPDHARFDADRATLVAFAADGSRVDVSLGTPPDQRAGEVRASIHPNPFNPRTRIELELPSASDTTVEILDLAGRRVRRLQEGVLTPGLHALAWNGIDDRGRPVSSGVYLVRIVTDMGTLTRRAVLLK